MVWAPGTGAWVLCVVSAWWLTWSGTAVANLALPTWV